MGDGKNIGINLGGGGPGGGCTKYAIELQWKVDAVSQSVYLLTVDILITEVNNSSGTNPSKQRHQ